MADYPVQLHKVQAPPLREETLARGRLLDWLGVKIHRRAILVLAEAGYGKTTLLADFSRRSRVPVAWYRLDRGDRDWPGFIAHLVAAFRIHRPDVAPLTQSMVREAGSEMPALDAVLDTFLRELGELPAEPAALVLDDFHLVDDAPDVRHVVRELMARSPERLTFILISRRMPPLPLARLRSLGELAELRTVDLRFMPEETEQLFRETFALNVETSVVAELSRRTEGWIASLQLVRAAIRDRNESEIRAFVRSLSGAEGDLYDYVAEEVVGELPAELQHFLMRTSLLELVEPVLGSVAAGITRDETRARIAEGEDLGLFSRAGPNSRDQVRAHPLVRDFLESRLGRLVGPDEVARTHRAIATAAEPLDWRIAGHHFIAAGDREDARRVLAGAIESILAAGAYSAAEELVTALPQTDDPDPNVLVVLSRLAQQRGQPVLGRELAEQAYATDPSSAAAALNLQSARFHAGDIEATLDLAAIIEATNESSTARLIARAVRQSLDTSVVGDIRAASTAMRGAVDEFRRRGDKHYLGVGLLNLGHLQLAAGDARSAFESSREAIDCLEETSAGIELVSARLVNAWALGHEGLLADARAQISQALAMAPATQRIEIALEGGEVEILYGSPREAQRLLALLDAEPDAATDQGEQALLVKAQIDLATGRLREASSNLEQLRPGMSRSAVAFDVRRQLAVALHAYLAGLPTAVPLAERARGQAALQGAFYWERVGRLYEAAARGSLGTALKDAFDRDAGIVSVAADAVAGSLGQLEPAEMAAVHQEALRRPERWRPVLRAAAANAAQECAVRAAMILDEVGTKEDVPLLRRMIKPARGALPSNLGRGLARRLALRVVVEDLGRVRIRIGDRLIDGQGVRRKVLALLCFLLTKQRFSATRDEVLDALWPNLEPSTALNSLNQTVYFLRRVFEPEFSEDLSPGYVGQDGETVWIDTELVTSRSADCRELIRTFAAAPDPERALELGRSYVGRFALDFMYEEWASPYRDSLHAAYLRAIEAALRADIGSGQFSRGIQLAQLASEVEPDSEEIQLALLRLYRLTGSTAAAAEQYERYSRSMRDLGVEALPFESL